MIATDSQAIMQLVDRDLWSPFANSESKHRILIRAIANKLINRARHGLCTNVAKVKSHIGIQGNEKADELAGWAAEHLNELTHRVDIGGAFDGLCWPGILPKDGDANGELFLLSNLNQAVKNASKTYHQTGMTNQTLYADIWDGLRNDLELERSNDFWRRADIKAATVKQVLKARFGVMWNMRQAFKMQLPYFTGGPIARTLRCPLCNEPDSTTHMLNGCLHKEMKALQISRHDEAGRLILKEVLRGKHGASHVVADLGRYEKVKGLGIDDNRVDKDLLPDQAFVRAGLSRQMRSKMRPDILMARPINMGSNCRKRKRIMERCSAQHIDVVEVGYTSEGRYHDKLEEKLNQHKELVNLLTLAGHTVKTHVIVLGSTGGLFRSTTEALVALGVEHTRCNKLLRRLHVHSIRWLHTMVKKRRQLESTHSPQARKKKPPDI